LAVDLEADLVLVRRALAADIDGRLSAAVECRLLKAAHARQQGQLRAATAGARTVEMRPLPNGAAMVRVDEGTWFKLSRGDARLVYVLARSGTWETDQFPAWRVHPSAARLSTNWRTASTLGCRW
jgi:hypothetical protein